MNRKICVITGSRAEYGGIRPLLSLLQKEKGIRLQLIVSGAHLSPQWGNTWREIKSDGFHINEKININVQGDTALNIAQSMGMALAGFAKAYARLKPDIIVGMGDRYEMFSAFAAALVSRIPVVHLSGGEVTQGAFDDSLRHAMTKMSSLHFVTNREHRKRVIQLGEEPKKVFNLGEVALDRIKQMRFMTREELQEDLGICFKSRNLLVTYHPVTMLKPGESVQQLKALLEALSWLKDTQLIFTKANSDPEGRYINTLIADFVAQRPQERTLFSSLGSLRYLSLMKEVDVVIGNSSSALIEAPSLYKPAVNIGDRQKGRLRARNVIDCPPQAKAIAAAVKKACSASFIRSLKNLRNPYGDGNSGRRIIQILRKIPLESLRAKEFHDQ